MELGQEKQVVNHPLSELLEDCKKPKLAVEV